MAATILLAAAIWGGQAQAQPRQVVTTCGTQTLVVGDGNNGYIDATGLQCGKATTTPSATTPTGTPQYGLTVAAATSLTVPADALLAQITVEGQLIRCREDGTAPTTLVGSLYQIGAVLYVRGSTLAALKCIQTAATATLDVEYFK